MLLVLTSQDDATADYLTDRLHKEGVGFVRIDTDDLICRTTISYRIGQPVVCFDGREYRPEDISDIWYRRPEKLKDYRFANSPEGQFAVREWSEALEGFFAHLPPTRWMNHPAANFAAGHKLEQLSVANALGFSIPLTIVTQDEAVLRTFFKECGGRVITKPLSNGYIERSKEEIDSLIYTSEVSADELNHLNDLATCPTLFQQFIEKEFDVRITVVDERVHAAELHAKDPDGSQRCDVRRNNMVDVVSKRVVLPTTIESQVLKLSSTTDSDSEQLTWLFRRAATGSSSRSIRTGSGHGWI